MRGKKRKRKRKKKKKTKDDECFGEIKEPDVLDASLCRRNKCATLKLGVSERQTRLRMWTWIMWKIPF